MSVTGTVLISDAYRDLGGMWAGMSTGADVLQDCLRELNSIVDQWAQERLFVLKSDGSTLASFDLATAYTLAPGFQLGLQKNLAVGIAPRMKLYWKIPDPLLEELAAQAAALKNNLYGVGV